MTTLALDTLGLLAKDRKAPPRPKADWPLMGDVATIRAGVPETLIHWRKARGETPPKPQMTDLPPKR